MRRRIGNALSAILRQRKGGSAMRSSLCAGRSRRSAAMAGGGAEGTKASEAVRGREA
jgi:hypothetical protein